MDNKQIRKLQSINGFPDLLAYLRDELDWPIEDFEFDELTFDYTPEELGIDEHNAAKILEIKRLRPLDDNQPWGIFFVSLEPKQLPVVALRRLLSKISLKKRASAIKAEQAAWHHDDILFISNFGEENERQLSFAHFAVNKAKHDLPILKVLGWDNKDTKLHVDYVVEMLKEKLIWPDDVEDTESWRQQWREAFTLRHKQVVSDSKEMAIRLSELARSIRDSILSVLEVESEKGPMRQIMETFKEALIHDLDDAGFADMYAQTIAYGLLSARIADPHGSNTVEHLGNHMRTNPFLRELMETFLDVGGRKRGRQKGTGLDFDELGVSEVVELLDNADMEAVVRDFGDRNRQEDPVMHFYESFLHEYNKQLKNQRGVFYTPQPVVSYIVRSVHELLQTEFGLEDGLADTTTWGEMLKKHPDMKLPPLTDELGEKQTISPDEFFVQILDPATGTATFLIEVIDVIHHTMTAKWRQQNKKEKEIDSLWNDYVPKYLLPRLHAYELMMAPYAIAHMKIGLKLAETGYLFQRDERVRIYLTNALDSSQRQLKLPQFDALAHEVAEVNEIKRYKRFTVVIGNPPYSLVSANMGTEHRNLIERFKFIGGERIRERGALQLEKILNDDYVKFIAKSQDYLSATGFGLLGIITNHAYLDNPTMRAMRENLMGSFRQAYIYDLGGSAKKQAADVDENVFEILQGVAITLFVKSGKNESEKYLYARLLGARKEKYSILRQTSVALTQWNSLFPTTPLYLLVPTDYVLRHEYEQFVPLTEIFIKRSIGLFTSKDSLVIDWTAISVRNKVRAFQQSNLSNKELCDQVGITAKAAWNVTKSRKQLSDINNLRDYIVSFLHRPFDSKYLFYERSLVWSMAWPVNRNLMVKGNLALTVSRQLSAPPWRHVFCSNTIVELCYITNKTKEGNHVFPLYLLPDEKGGQISLTGHDSRELNFNPDFIREFSASLRVGIDTYLGLPKGLTPEDIFNYIYAVFHSPGYRSRYEEFLKIDFPRLPLTDDLKIFRALAKLGGELIALHLLESPKLKKTATKFIGKNPVVSKVGWTPDDGGTVWLDGKGTAKNFQPGTTGFCSVPEEVWNYRIGAYQVCEKWLKDRGPHKGNPGRTLTNDDIAHYNKIVIALTETIRIMAEIDVVIESHGGWPGAFVTDSGGVKETDSEVTYPDSDREQAQLDMVVEPKDG